MKAPMAPSYAGHSEPTVCVCAGDNVPSPGLYQAMLSFNCKTKTAVWWLLLVASPWGALWPAHQARPAVRSPQVTPYQVDIRKLKAAMEKLSSCRLEFEQAGFYEAKQGVSLTSLLQKKGLCDGAWAVDAYYQPEKLLPRVMAQKRVFGYVALFSRLLKDDPFFDWARKHDTGVWHWTSQDKYELLSSMQEALKTQEVYYLLLLYLSELYDFLKPSWARYLQNPAAARQELETFNRKWWARIPSKAADVCKKAFGVLQAYIEGTPLYYMPQLIGEEEAPLINRIQEPLRLVQDVKVFLVDKHSYASFISRLLAKNEKPRTYYVFWPVAVTSAAKEKIAKHFFELAWPTFPWAERISAYWFRGTGCKEVFPEILYAQIAAYVGSPFSLELLRPLRNPPDTSQWKILSDPGAYRKYKFLQLEMMYERLSPQEAPNKEAQGYQDKGWHVSPTVCLSNAIEWSWVDMRKGSDSYHLPLHRSDTVGSVWLGFNFPSCGDLLTSSVPSKSGGFMKLGLRQE